MGDPVILSIFQLTVPVGSIAAEILAIAVLLLFSALISGAEVAFFSLSPQELIKIKNAQHRKDKVLYSLINSPKHLLATMLIANNLVNVAIVIISSLAIAQVFDFSHHPVFGLIIEVIAVTFIIVLLAEVLPKVYATKKNVGVAYFMAYPLFVLSKLLGPLSALMVGATSFVDKKLDAKRYTISIDELTHAIDITSDKNTPEQEKKILKGIVRFGNIDVKQIMKPRIDVVAFEYSGSFEEILRKAKESGYSRIPVYKGNLDKIAGVLYVKDLLAHLEKPAHFNWQSLIRQPYFVPESKKINDLLREFQDKKMHLAVVVDEYGGSCGIVTLEDVLEEIVGEISDEFDDDELVYSKLDEHNYVFEGKTLMNDVCRVTGTDRAVFEKIHGETDTLAGLVLELAGKIPGKNEKIYYQGYTFSAEAVDKRSVKRIKITLPEKVNA